MVILDCCYSGRAAGGMADRASAVANEATVEGTYLLASAPPNKQSLSPPGETYTAFTGALLAVLTDGVPNEPEFLQLDVIYRHVHDALKRAARPAPQLRAANTVGTLALVRDGWRGSSPTAQVRNVPTATKRAKKQAKPRLRTKATPAKRPSARQRVQDLLDDADLTGWYGCPVCQAAVAGSGLARHVDEHQPAEVAALDPATVTLEACQRDLDNRYRLGEFIGARGRSGCAPRPTCAPTGPLS